MRVTPYEFWKDLVTSIGIVAATVSFASESVIGPFVQKIVLIACFWLIIISIIKMIYYRSKEYRTLSEKIRERN